MVAEFLQFQAEISRLKKKYQAEIAELEMTVDNLNRANIEAQKTIKKLSEQLKVLQASLEDTQRQLQQTLDQVIQFFHCSLLSTQTIHNLCSLAKYVIHIIIIFHLIDFHQAYFYDHHCHFSAWLVIKN